MKITTALTITLLTLGAVARAETAPTSTPAARPHASGRISEVVLYRDRARITRALEVSVAARDAGGTVEIVVGDLPRRLVPESLRLEVDDGVGMTSVLHRVVVPAGRGGAGGEPAARRIEDREAAIANELEMLRAQSVVLDGLAGYASRALPADLDRALLQADEVTKLALFAFEHRERLALRTEELLRDSRRLAEERAALEAAREATTGGDREPHNVAVVRLAPRRPGPLTVRLEYLVDGVGWEPSYRVRGGSSSRTVEVEYGASIRQESGEDWRDAVLRLAPARAPRRARAPRLDSLALELTKSAPPGDRARRGAAARQLAELATARKAPEREARVAPSRDSLRPIEVGRVSLASRSEPRTLRLADLRLAGEFYRVAVPLTGSEVYREARVRNDTDDALPSGPVRAYFDGEFAGEGRIAGVAPGEDFAIGFGADPLLRASRRLLGREESIEGSRRRVVARYRLAVENRSGAPVALRLLDRLPSANPQSGVRVALESLADAAHELPEDEAAAGVVRWDVEVPAAAAAPWTLEYGIVVEYDRGFHLVLDRDAAPRAAAAASPHAAAATGWQVLD